MQAPDQKIAPKVAMSGSTTTQINLSVGVFNSVRQASSSHLSASNIPSVGDNRASYEQPWVHQPKSGLDIQSTSHRSQSASSRSDGFVPSCSSSLAGAPFGDDKGKGALFAGSRCNGELQHGVT